MPAAPARLRAYIARFARSFSVLVLSVAHAGRPHFSPMRPDHGRSRSAPGTDQAPCDGWHWDRIGEPIARHLAFMVAADCRAISVEVAHAERAHVSDCHGLDCVSLRLQLRMPRFDPQLNAADTCLSKNPGNFCSRPFSETFRLPPGGFRLFGRASLRFHHPSKSRHGLPCHR
jgi:hypothetical protein